VAALRDRHGMDVKLALAGFVVPSMRDSLAGLASRLRIEDRVEQLGQVPQARVGELLTTASALVVPSTWEEPLGLVNVEGALARVPVVASRSGGMTETLLEDEHALYFPIGDHDACADALARVLEQKEETAARAERAFERAQAFTFDRYMAQMNEFVERAAAARQPRSAQPRSPA
jgi:glycosyltransferase involved in cell wall biosynthesis